MVEKENDIVAVTPVTVVKTSENNAAAVTTSVDSAVNNRMTNGTPPNKSNPLKSLAFHFLEAYYTKLSDHPDDIGTFYGDDSKLVLGEVEEAGRENIQNAIANMNFGNCKSRFYSIKPVVSGDSRVLQVCGELTLRGQPAPRRFLQTIVLASPSSAPPNVLYVQSNIFQWMDSAFPVNGPEKVYFISPPNTVPPPQSQPTENGGVGYLANSNNPVAVEKPLQNGGTDHHVHVQPVKTPTIAQQLEMNKEPELSAITQSPPPGLEKLSNEQQPVAQVKKSPVKQETPPPAINGHPLAAAEKTLPSVDNDDGAKNITSEVNKKEEVKKDEPQQQHQKTTKPVEPKSWNNVVSGNRPPTAKQQQQFPAMKKEQTPPQHPPVAVQKETNNPQNDHRHNQQQQPVHQAKAPMNRDRSSSDDATGGNGPAGDTQQNKQQPGVGFVRPRSEWSHRIYFNNLAKPNKWMDNKLAQDEMKNDLMDITQGIEFVAIKPNSLRPNYKYAFGFVDFTTEADMNAIYAAAKKGGDRSRLKVKIPHFEFDGFITLTNDKTLNMGGGGGHNNNNPSGGGGGNWSNSNNFYHSGSGGGGNGRQT